MDSPITLAEKSTLVAKWSWVEQRVTPQLMPLMKAEFDDFIEHRSKLMAVANVGVFDTPPRGAVYANKKWYACSSEFSKLQVVCPPMSFKCGVVTMNGKERKTATPSDGEPDRCVLVTDMVVKYECAGCDETLVTKSLSKKKTYTPMVIKVYRLFWVSPHSPMFMCMHNGEYVVVPGFLHRATSEPAVCMHVNDDVVHCMACLSKFCVPCLNGVMLKTCPHCMY
jgi:hypothetical protein